MCNCWDWQYQAFVVFDFKPVIIGNQAFLSFRKLIITQILFSANDSFPSYSYRKCYKKKLLWLNSLLKISFWCFYSFLPFLVLFKLLHFPTLTLWKNFNRRIKLYSINNNRGHGISKKVVNARLMRL